LTISEFEDKLIGTRTGTATIMSISRLTAAAGLSGLCSFDPWKHAPPHGTAN
jgi:hypothetical protein